MGIRYLLLLAAGLALADASVVTLALPPIIDELDASVEGAAAVLGSYTLVLGLALPGAAWVRVEVGSRALGAGGALLFAAASLGCGLAGSLGVLLALRGVQAVGAAAVLVAAFALLDAGETGRRAWTATAIFGFAAGPALGGALTQALDWRAIFLVQVPIAVAAAVVAWRAPEPSERHVEAAPWPAGPVVALSLVSAALVGVLFLLVLLLVTGWSVSPLAAAAAVTVLPVIAVAAARIRGPARVRAAAGAALLGGGVLALASLPGASLWWTVLPQAMAGAGMGLALPALAGELLPERTPEQAARLLATRHIGITVALVLLAPIAATRIDAAVADGREQGTALVLDARLPPLEKLSLAGSAGRRPRSRSTRAASCRRRWSRRASGIDQRGPCRLRHARRARRRRARDRRAGGVRAGVRDLRRARAAGGLGGPPARPARADGRRGRRRSGAGAGRRRAARPARARARAGADRRPVRGIATCRTPAAIDGALQDVALIALDRAACRYGSSREQLALALVDDGARADYEREFGVDPRDIGGLLGAVLGI